MNLYISNDLKTGERYEFKVRTLDDAAVILNSDLKVVLNVRCENIQEPEMETDELGGPTFKEFFENILDHHGFQLVVRMGDYGVANSLMLFGVGNKTERQDEWMDDLSVLCVIPGDSDYMWRAGDGLCLELMSNDDLAFVRVACNATLIYKFQGTVRMLYNYYGEMKNRLYYTEYAEHLLDLECGKLDCQFSEVDPW